MFRSQYFSSLNEKAKPNLGIRGRRKTKFKKSRKQRKNKSSKMKRPKFYGGEIYHTHQPCPFCNSRSPVGFHSGTTILYNEITNSYNCYFCNRIFKCGDPPQLDNYRKYVFNKITKGNCTVLNENDRDILQGPNP